MLVSIFSPKGGSGTSTNACLLAKSFSRHMPSMPIVLIDAFNGDLDSIVGIDPESEYGFAQWLESANPNIHNLEKISNSVFENLTFVSNSSVKHDRFSSQTNSVEDKAERYEKITSALSDDASVCIVDLGTRVDALSSVIVAASDLVVMAIKSCYVSLNRATAHPYREYADACIFIEEQGRSINSKQVSEVLKINCIIELDARRDFARAIDAGVLLFRTPKNMIASIDAFVSDVCDHLEGAQNHVVLNQSRVRARGEEEYDRTKNISRENFDIFDESAQGNKRDFWSEENSSHNSRQDSHSAVEQREMPQRSRRTERPKPIDVAYTSHLHNAFAGIKNKSGRR